MFYSKQAWIGLYLDRRGGLGGSDARNDVMTRNGAKRGNNVDGVARGRGGEMEGREVHQQQQHFLAPKYGNSGGSVANTS